MRRVERVDIDFLLGGNPPDSVAGTFGEPYVAIRTGRDACRSCIGRDTYAELGDHPGGRNPPDPVAVTFREPHVAIGARRYAQKACIRGDDSAELSDDPCRSNPPDAAKFREPKITIGAGRDSA